MSILSKNLVFLRKNIKNSQAEISSGLDVPTSTYANWEYEKSEPSIEHIMDICQIFAVTPTQLLAEELKIHPLDARPKPKNSLSDNDNKPDLKPDLHPDLISQKGIKKASQKEAISLINEPLNQYKAGFKTPQMPKLVTVDHGGAENIVFVPIKAAAGYLLGHGDPSYLEHLPSFRMPGLNNGTFRMFEVQGLSMYPTLHPNDKVVCQWVPSHSEIRENRIHVILHKDGIAIKRVLNRIENRGKVYIKSDTITQRNEYPTLELNPEDILEIWYVRMRVTSELQEPSELYTRMSEAELNITDLYKRLSEK